MYLDNITQIFWGKLLEEPLRAEKFICVWIRLFDKNVVVNVEDDEATEEEENNELGRAF